MTDPWGAPDPNAQPVAAASAEPGLSLSKDAPGSYGAPPSGYGAPADNGPPGRQRGTGVSILLFVVTFGIYGLVYNYKVHSEMKGHGDRGIGGGVALLLTVIAGVAMPFVTPSEVGSLYSRRGEKAPVSGWTGLWLVGATVVAYVIGIVGVVGAAATSTSSVDESGQVHLSNGSGGAVVVALLAAFALYVAGALIWFAKTNGALNRYWARAAGS